MKNPFVDICWAALQVIIHYNHITKNKDGTITKSIKKLRDQIL